MAASSIGLERHRGSRVTEGGILLRQPPPHANRPIRATNSHFVPAATPHSGKGSQYVMQIEVTPKFVSAGAAITVRVSGYDGPTGFAPSRRTAPLLNKLVTDSASRQGCG